MMNTLRHFFTSLVDWLFRRRSPGVRLVSIGTTLLIALGAAGFAFSVSIPTSYGPLNVSYDSGSGISWLFCVLLVLVFIIIFTGLFLIWRDEKRQQSKKVIAVELRGLRDTSGQPLHASIPNKFIGNRDSLLLDIRQSADGIIRSPQDALTRLLSLPSNIASRESGFSRSDITIVAAGLAPVPFSFLMGFLLDDESRIILMDWDRSGENWRSLSDEDDRARFTTHGLDVLNEEKEAVLSVSVSYKTDISAIKNVFPELPIIDMTLGSLSVDGHWSEEKQIALSKQFFDTLRTIESAGVKKIHLILAAPNSLVIRFGRTYDKRNLPELVVYQYEKTQKPAYPWGVRMPVGNTQAGILET